MPRRKEEGSNAIYWIAMMLIGVLLLKGFGILSARARARLLPKELSIG
jgi:hypothetical protein